MQTKNIAIIGVVAIACAAIIHGFNGVIIASSMAIVAGLGGYELRVAKEKKKNG